MLKDNINKQKAEYEILLQSNRDEDSQDAPMQDSLGPLRHGMSLSVLNGGLNGNASGPTLRLDQCNGSMTVRDAIGDEDDLDSPPRILVKKLSMSEC